MAVYKVVDKEGKYMDDAALGTVHNYIVEGARNMLYYGTSEGFVVDDFVGVQAYHGKENGKKLRHTVISFDRTEKPSLGIMEAVARKVCEEHANDFQIIAGIHMKKNQNHIHFMMNPVNYKTGKRFHKTHEEFDDEKDTVEDILNCYGYELER